MFEKLRSFFGGLLFLLKDSLGVVASMVSMTGDTTSDPTSLDYARPEIWEQRLRFNAARKSFFGPLKGKELSGKPIIEREDFVNQAGDVVHINVMSESFGPGITGENTLRGNEDALSLGQFNVTVDWLRKAFALTKKIKKQVNFDMLQQVRVRAENWLARELDANVFSELLTDVTDTLYAGNATSEATLSDDDTFTTHELDKIKLALDRMGALPITVEREGGQETYHYACVISEVDEYNLRGDDRWLDACKYAQIRGDKNPIFTGRPIEWNGLLV
jgi:N4-gp56 family major capsid protein